MCRLFAHLAEVIGGVPTSPRPAKWCCQTRLTMTHGVSVLVGAGDPAHRAKLAHLVTAVSYSTRLAVLDHSTVHQHQNAAGVTLASGDSSTTPLRIWISCTAPDRFFGIEYPILFDVKSLGGPL